MRANSLTLVSMLPERDLDATQGDLQEFTKLLMTYSDVATFESPHGSWVRPKLAQLMLGSVSVHVQTFGVHAVSIKHYLEFAVWIDDNMS